MSDNDTSVNIKKLPETNEIKFGDFLMVENTEGTQILKFDNFIITEFNTTFEGTLSALKNDASTNIGNIKSLSSNQGILSGLWTPYLTNMTTMSSIGIGIGDVPGEKLTVNGNVSASGAAYFECLSSFSGNNYFNNKVGIGTAAPEYTFDIQSSSLDVGARIKSTGTDGKSKYRLENDEKDWSLCVDGFQANKFQVRDETSNLPRLTIDNVGNIGLGEDNPQTTVHVGSVSACISLNEYSDTTPLPLPSNGSQAMIYVKGDKFILKFNDGGQVRYKYIPLNGTSVTWTHSTSEP